MFNFSHHCNQCSLPFLGATNSNYSSNFRTTKLFRWKVREISKDSRTWLLWLILGLLGQMQAQDEQSLELQYKSMTLMKKWAAAYKSLFSNFVLCKTVERQWLTILQMCGSSPWMIEDCLMNSPLTRSNFLIQNGDSMVLANSSKSFVGKCGLGKPTDYVPFPLSTLQRQITS